MVESVEDMPTSRSSTDRTDTAPADKRASGGPLRLLGRLTILFCVGAAAALVLGFVWFTRSLPTSEVQLIGNADGIVALTGGASRVVDALELLQDKRAQRLLISGASRSTDAKEILRLHPEFQTAVKCCVDFDRSLNTLGNAVETRKWAESKNIRSLIVVTSGYHMPRAMAEIAHQLPGVRLIAFPVFSEQARSEPWWPDGVRRHALEYLKFLFAHVRIRVNPDAGRSA
jgi:uncharacterized SAM-binding protein YcdF (DUF218 family)